MRVGLIIKKSAWDLYQEHPGGRIQELFERRDPTVANILPAHREHSETVAAVKAALAAAKVSVVRIRLAAMSWQAHEAEFDDRELDLVITVGGDGTLLRASHSVRRIPVLAINSAPTYSVGFFCGASKEGAAEAIAAALAGRLNGVPLTRMQVRLNGEVVTSRVLNDALFCHQSPAATARYIIEHGGAVEEQKSSGIWIGPAAGSTAAQHSAGGKVLPLASADLQMVVREPYKPRGRPYRLTRLIVKPGEKLIVRSKSRQMRLFFDGPDRMARAVLGDVVEFEEGPDPLLVLGISARRKWHAQ